MDYAAGSNMNLGPQHSNKIVDRLIATNHIKIPDLVETLPNDASLWKSLLREYFPYIELTSDTFHLNPKNAFINEYLKYRHEPAGMRLVMLSLKGKLSEIENAGIEQESCQKLYILALANGCEAAFSLVDPKRLHEALQLACSNGHLCAVRAILALNPKFTGKQKGDALLTPAQKGYVEIVALLLSHDIPDYLISTAFISAAPHPAVALLLLNTMQYKIVDPNQKAQVLLSAATQGDYGVVQILMFDKNIPLWACKTALFSAAQHNHIQIVDLLLSKIRPLLSGEELRKMIKDSSRNGYLGLMPILRPPSFGLAALRVGIINLKWSSGAAGIVGLFALSLSISPVAALSFAGMAFASMEIMRQARNWFKTRQYSAYSLKEAEELNNLTQSELNAFDGGCQSAKSVNKQFLNLFSWHTYRESSAYYAGFQARSLGDYKLIDEIKIRLRTQP